MVPPQQQQPTGARGAAQQNPGNAPMLAPANVAHGMPAHMMNFVPNPAQPHLFPPSLLGNPEALMGMPGMFAPHPSQPTGHVRGQQSSVMVPGMATVIGNQAVANGFNTNAHPAPAGQQQQPQLLQQQGMPNMQQHAQIAPNNQPGMMTQRFATKEAPAPTTLGGVPIPPLPPHSSTAMQVQVAAAAAAAAAAPLRSAQQPNAKHEEAKGAAKSKKADLTPAQKAKQNRDRNREHARSTRLRKKAYVQKLKELVEALHAERTEEVRKRRVAIQHLSEVQGVRRAVVRSFLRFHSNYESDPRKWMTILEDNFWYKQPVTPYRSFRRAEVEQECRISRGIEAMVADAASTAVMVEGIGSRSSRWMQLKREEVLSREDMNSGASHMPQSIDRENSRLQHAVSSLSSSSGSSNGSGGEEDRQRALAAKQQAAASASGEAKKVSSSSGSSSDSRRKTKTHANDYHDYHAPALPDPRLGDSEGSSPSDPTSSDSPEDSNSNGEAGRGSKQVSTDSSSGDEDKSDIAVKPPKRRKVETSNGATIASPPAAASVAQSRSSLPPNIAKSGGISHNIRPVAGPIGNGNARLSLAPAISLPPFVGIGKKRPPPAPTANSTTIGVAVISSQQSLPNVVPGAPPGRQGGTHLNGPTTVSSNSSNGANGAVVAPRNDLAAGAIGGPSVIAPDVGDSSSNSSNNNNSQPRIRAYYHVNEDDMLLTDDVLMCPFVFRSQDAVLCGALSECVMPGMLRAHFSPRNKLLGLEMVYDAMGFMQQLERASGSDNLAQVVPGSLEMALAPNAHEARVITLAKSPFLIVSVNEAWTRVTKFTQMEVEGHDLGVLSGARTIPDVAVVSGKPAHKFDEVAKGLCTSSTNIHYDKEGREFIDFVCSYPLTNSNNEVTHLLHVFKDLPQATSPTHEFQETSSGDSDNRNLY